MSSLSELTQHKDFDALFDEIRATFVRQWLKENSVEAREHIHIKTRVLEEVKMALRNAATGMSDGRNTSRD